MIEIREMSSGDIGPVAVIEAESPSAWSPRILLAELQYKQGHRFVAVSKPYSDKPLIVGWCASRSVGGEAELLKIAVRKQYRRLGVGGLLTGALTKALKSEDVKKLFLEVRSGNSGAISFYKRSACIETGRRINYYTHPKDDALLFELSLTGNDSALI